MLLKGDIVGRSDSGNRVIFVVIIPPTVPLMMTTSLFKLPESISGVNDEGDGGDIPGANVDVSPIRSNKKYIKFFKNDIFI